MSHTLLGSLSALGAHRAKLADHCADEGITRAGDHIANALDAIAADLVAGRRVAPSNDEEAALASQLEQLPEESGDQRRLARTQLSLICRQLASIRNLALQLQKNISV
jgi:uncharacterized membrane protein YccC